MIRMYNTVSIIFNINNTFSVKYIFSSGKPNAYNLLISAAIEAFESWLLYALCQEIYVADRVQGLVSSKKSAFFIHHDENPLQLNITNYSCDRTP